MTERKKISDIKKTSAPIKPRADILRREKIEKPILKQVNIQLQKTSSKLEPLNIQKKESPHLSKPIKIISITTWLKWFSITGFFFGIMYIVLLFAYHGNIYVQPKPQQVSISEIFTAVPKESFTGNEKTIPYYIHISDIQLDDEATLDSPEIFERLQSVLPSDVIVLPDYLFIGQTGHVNEKFVSIIFFKKQDVENYIYTHLISPDYKSVIRNIKNIQFTPQQPVTQITLRSFFPVRFSVDFYAEGDTLLDRLPSMVSGQDIHMCREILQKVKEINVDKCTVFPFWYNKIPKNPKFIRIITK